MASILDDMKKIVQGRMLLIAFAAAFVFAGIVVLLLWGNGQEYQVLYTQLSPDDSGAVVGWLRDKKIIYRVDGASISVPSEKVYELRMQLAGEGLPHGGGVGFEIFDKTGFGMSDFVQKVNYKRALQGEIARTIAGIKEVESARVHLAIPENGIFLDDKKKSSASIVLKLRGAKTLSEAQVAAIVHLVANSFENLRPEDVTVVDSSGRLFARGTGEDGAMRLTGAQLERRQAIEKDLESRIQSMLEKTVGMGKAVARVSADVDTRQVERTEETFDPDSQVVRSEQRNKEKTTGSGGASGVPGVLSNMPETQASKDASIGAKSETSRQDEVINYEINKVVNHIVEPVGAIKRLSISVLVDGTYETVKGEDGKDTGKYTARSDSEIGKFTEMVKAAAGFSAERGDVVSVVSTPFEAEAVESAQQEEKPSIISPQVITLVPSVLRYGSTAVVALFLILFVLRPLIRSIGPGNAGVSGAERALPDGAAGRYSLEAETGAGATNEQNERLRRTVKENPHQAAMLVKGWIKEK